MILIECFSFSFFEVAADSTLRQSTGLPSMYYHHNNPGMPALSSSPSPTPSPNAHRAQC